MSRVRGERSKAPNVTEVAPLVQLWSTIRHLPFVERAQELTHTTQKPPRSQRTPWRTHQSLLARNAGTHMGTHGHTAHVTHTTHTTTHKRNPGCSQETSQWCRSPPVSPVECDTGGTAEELFNQTTLQMCCKCHAAAVRRGCTSMPAASHSPPCSTNSSRVAQMRAVPPTSSLSVCTETDGS